MTRVQIFRPCDYDREHVERAREVIEFAKKVLAESDPSILMASTSPQNLGRLRREANIPKIYECASYSASHSF
jgi:hypothetical protein